MRFFEKLDDFVGGARAVRFYFTRRWFFKELLVERRLLREEMVALGEEAALASTPAESLPAAPTGHTV